MNTHKFLFTKKTLLNECLTICLTSFMLFSCGKNTPENADLLYDFHKATTPAFQHEIHLDSVALYVDYTTGLAMKSRIKFYWEIMKPIFVSKTESYYSIKGQDISKEAGDVGMLLDGVSNYENPNLKDALNRIVDSDHESILITDAELVNPSEPFMKDAFIKWLLKGHDVFIIAEPYFEGPTKKNIFYFVFSDSKLDGNIADYIKRVGKIHHFPKISSFNLSTTAFVKGMKGGHSDPNGFVQAMVTRNGDFELQEWSTGWEDKIEKYVLNIKDRKGNDLPESAVLIDGLQLDRMSIGGMRITGVQMKVYNINEEYSDYCNAVNEGQTPEIDRNFGEFDHFIIQDMKAFDSNSVFKLYFDRQNYDDSILDGKPFNYFKISFYINEIQESLDDIKDFLVFEDRFKKGYKNVSVFESVKQTLEDKDVNDFLANSPIYSIYVKALAK